MGELTKEWRANLRCLEPEAIASLDTFTALLKKVPDKKLRDKLEDAMAVCAAAYAHVAFQLGGEVERVYRKK